MPIFSEQLRFHSTTISSDLKLVFLSSCCCVNSYIKLPRYLLVVDIRCYLTSSYLPSQYFLFCRRLRYILSRTGGRVADLEKIKSAPHCHKLFINHSFSQITIVTIYSPYNCHNLLLTRLQRDPGISRDPGIDLQSRSRDF